ncbi:hypothetical protein HYC85_016944 [Camellia sinensis]|uniref:Uncharacterized protein n=1 Tax=Camellia sinensis TaxID=4442 RepID=A0A7J7H4P1_CAMSI|nr:hypothetical protein HYC85_016944 [Camellia sinensis]
MSINIHHYNVTITSITTIVTVAVAVSVAAVNTINVSASTTTAATTIRHPSTTTSFITVVIVTISTTIISLPPLHCWAGLLRYPLSWLHYMYCFCHVLRSLFASLALSSRQAPRSHSVPTQKSGLSFKCSLVCVYYVSKLQAWKIEFVVVELCLLEKNMYRLLFDDHINYVNVIEDILTFGNQFSVLPSNPKTAVAIMLHDYQVL